MTKNLLLFLLCLLIYAPSPAIAQVSNEWYMAGANPQRTSWVNSGNAPSSNLLWFRPIEAYIDQKAQVIAANGKLYISTSRGLISLDAANGDLAWRFDTQLPLGHSPTVDLSQNPPVVYVGGYDKKLYALNANTGQLIWTFNGAEAGYNTNPLVIEGKVILGNRDGGLYAINAVGSTNAGQQAWKFQTDGPIMFSAAYKNGIAYIASNDQHAYAVRVSNGTQVWKSQKLIGDGFHTYFPVVYRDKIILSTTYTKGGHGENEFRMQNAGGGLWEPIFPGDPLASGVGGLIGTVEDPTSWSYGWNTLHPWRVLEHFEDNPDGDPLFHKPENRSFIVLNQSNGQEFTFDSDGDGSPEYIPFSFWRGHGTNYPVIVDLNDELAYGPDPIACCSDAKGKLYGWNIDHPSRVVITGASASSTSISQGGGWAAMAEPQSFSGSNQSIFRILCCDRAGSWFNTQTPAAQGSYWSYNLSGQINNYDDLWTISPVSISRHQGWYSGLYETTAGIYHSHGDQAPLVPYNGRVYAHRRNVILAYGTGTVRGQLPLISATQPTTQTTTPSEDNLRNRLNVEVQKIVEVNGHLRPGWNTGWLGNYGGNRFNLEDYFSNPGDTLYTLSYAYPYLSSTLQTQVRSYLADELIPDFFDTNPGSNNPTMYSAIGYSNGQPREWVDIHPEILSSFQPQQNSTSPGSWSFTYPQHNFYALYLYAKNVPGVNASRMYTLAKSKLRVPANVTNESTTFTNDPFQHNAWMTGYHGFLKLQELAGMTNTDATLRNSVTSELNRLVTLRATLFNQDSPWVDMEANTATNAKKTLDVAANFMFLSPEVANDYRNNSTLLQKSLAALDMYEDIAPFWLAGKYEATSGEATYQNLYNQPAIFQAHAWILQKPRQELYKYLDTPMFARGDLFYIQNLVATIQAPTDPNYTPPPVSPTPVLSLDGDSDVDFADFSVLIRNFWSTTFLAADFNFSGRVDIFDFTRLIRSWIN